MLFVGFGNFSGELVSVLGSDESINTNSDSNITTINKSDNLPSNRNIAFEWKDAEEGIGEIKLTYHSNNKFTYEYTDGDYSYIDIGSYSVSGNKLNIKSSDGTICKYTFSANTNKLILVDDFGYSHRFSKI